MSLPGGEKTVKIQVESSFLLPRQELEKVVGGDLNNLNAVEAQPAVSLTPNSSPIKTSPKKNPKKNSNTRTKKRDVGAYLKGIEEEARRGQTHEVVALGALRPLLEAEERKKTERKHSPVSIKRSSSLKTEDLPQTM